MLRFIAFCWDPRDRGSAGYATQLMQRWQWFNANWPRVLSAHGLAVFSITSSSICDEVHKLSQHAGVVIGPLFHKDAQSHDESGRRASIAFSDSESSRVVRTHGKHLVERYWGSYVAFICDYARGAKWIVRAPMGALPCFRLECSAVDVYLSRMEDCFALGLKLSFNWRYIASHIALHALNGRETGIENVSDIKGGECVEMLPSGTSVQLHWNPAEVAMGSPIEDAGNAARRVLEATVSCVHAWARTTPNIVHQLSGGLDSSIVAGCLADISDRAHVSCVNCYCNGSNADERRFARLAAENAGFPLIEIERPGNLRLEDAFNSASRTSIIYSYFLRYEHAIMMRPLAASIGAEALFTGNGGDEVFFRGSKTANLAVRDFISSHGVSGKLGHVILDAARIEKVSIWRIIGGLVADSFSQIDLPLSGSLSNVPDRLASLVHMPAIRVLTGSANPSQPWIAALSEAPPGKLGQILTLSPRSYDSPFARPNDPEIVNPLLSQPVVETCLQIPTYIHIHNGVSRAIARRAFVGRVPRAILERVTKGGVEEHGKEVLIRNLGFIRGMLLDGVLVREGLLNRRKLEEALSPRPSRSQTLMGDVMALLSAEMWLALWNQRRYRAVA